MQITELCMNCYDIITREFDENADFCQHIKNLYNAYVAKRLSPEMYMFICDLLRIPTYVRKNRVYLTQYQTQLNYKRSVKKRTYIAYTLNAVQDGLQFVIKNNRFGFTNAYNCNVCTSVEFMLRYWNYRYADVHAYGVYLYQVMSEMEAPVEFLADFFNKDVRVAPITFKADCVVGNKLSTPKEYLLQRKRERCVYYFQQDDKEFYRSQIPVMTNEALCITDTIPTVMYNAWV